APVHQGHVPEHCVSRLGVKTVRGHADDMPVRRIRDVIFHQIGIVIGAALGCNLQIHTPGRMAYPDAGFDAKFMIRLLHQTQIHLVRNLALNQRPPDATLVCGSIHKNRGVAIPSLTEVHGGGSVSCTKQPTLDTVGIQLDRRTIEIINELGGSPPKKQKRGCEDQDTLLRAMPFHETNLVTWLWGYRMPKQKPIVATSSTV